MKFSGSNQIALDKTSLEQQRLLKYLVEQVAVCPASQILQQTEKTLDEVIAESDIDGVCYYLVRSRPKLDNKMNLSPREQSIAQLVAQGLPNKCIAKQLNISTWTVATHLRRIYSKLGVNSRTAMIARIMERN